MAQYFEDSSGRRHKFPDDATPEEIDAATSNFENNQSINSNKKLFEETIGADRSPVDTIRDLLQGVTSGLGKGGQEIASLATGGKAPKVDFDEMTNRIGSPNQSIGGNITKGIGEYLPYALAGGATLPGQIAAGGAFGTATGKPEQENLFGFLPKGKVGSAIESALLNAVTHGVGAGINKLRPSNLLRGNLSPEELTENVKATEGTNTPLGDVIGSPMLKRQFENVLTKIPFSNANQKLAQVGESINTKGSKVLSDLLGNKNSEEVDDQLHEILLKKFREQREIKNNLFNDFNQKADEQFLDLPLKEFSNKAKEYKDAIESTNLLKYEPQMKSILNKLGIYENPVVKIPGDTNPVSQFGEKMIGEPLTTHIQPTAKEANLLKSKLKDYSKIYNSSPDPEKRHIAKIFSELSSSLKNDIEGAIEKSGNKELKLAYDTANNNYKTNFSKFLDKDLYKYIGGNKDIDTLTQQFINTSKSADRVKHLKKLSNTLGEHKPLLAYSYFSRALDNEGNLNTGKLNTLINNLGKKQFEALVPDTAMRSAIKQFSKLYKMNPKAVSLMQNPATGQQSLDIIPALLAHAGSSMAGGAAFGWLGAIAGLVAPGLMAKPLVHALTSPSVRDSLIKAMINRKPLNKNIIPTLQTAGQSLMKD